MFGGGIAGLTAAHELTERGFDVTVYERRAWGGKCRSFEVPGTGSGGRRPLPGEHGGHAYFGFYQNVPDTMRRIPFGSNPAGTFDNLTSANAFLFARDNGRRSIVLPLGVADPGGYTPQIVLDTLIGLLLQTNLPPDAIAFFAGRMVAYLSSCDARRIGQWEHTTWTDFTGSDRFPDDYRKTLVNFFSEFVQASEAERTSAQFSANVLEWVIYNLLGRNSNGPVLRTLHLPSNEALYDPWVTHLGTLGVQMALGQELTRFNVGGGRIVGAQMRSSSGVSTVHADWYVCALPVERARLLMSDAILTLDPALSGMGNLDTAWMNGLQIYLSNRQPVIRKGAFVLVDSPWLIAGGNQADLWDLDFASRYGDGRVHDAFSIVISKWTEPGLLSGKPANQCTEQEIIAEVWEQLKRHLNGTGTPTVRDETLVSWVIDQGMIRSGGRLISDDPLVLPTVGQRADRPDVTTAIPNLFLTGDYLKSPWEVANMETTSYNSRRAVNAILDRAGSKETPAHTFEPYRPPEWEPFKQIDAQRYALGQPNLFDTVITSLPQLSALLSQVGLLEGGIQSLVGGLLPGL